MRLYLYILVIYWYFDTSYKLVLIGTAFNLDLFLTNLGKMLNYELGSNLFHLPHIILLLLVIQSFKENNLRHVMKGD